jgi:hypothetical protein
MKNLRLGVAMCGAVLAGLSAVGQMNKVAKPQQVVRAVGVYEWTGDMAKPTASRLIPVSLFINGKLEDAGIYLARPVPFALETGNVYELEKAGVGQGLLDLSYARRVHTADGDDRGAWLGYGSFKPPAAAKKGPVLRASKTLPVIVSSGDDSRPHFGKGGGTASSPSAGSPDAGSTTKETRPDAGSTPAGDPDRPTLKGRSADTDNTTAASTAETADQASNKSGDHKSEDQSGNEPADDPDRPTLKRRTPEEAKKAKVEAETQGSGAVEALNDDPNRPNLHYGKPAGSVTAAELPKLVGTPADLRQMVAVSDAVDRDEHDFARPWADGAEREAVLAKMEEMARAKLATYGDAAVAAPSTAASTAPSIASAAAKKKTRGRTRRSSAVTPADAPVTALLDTKLKGYTLSYGGAATYIFSAHTAGTSAALRYVTVVAQADDLGDLKPALQSVTDAAHLDRTPEMRFVDAVDAEASNRASLLFELRSQGSRQFVLYRVIASEAQLTFVSGPIQ